MESVPERLVEHMLRTITEQFKAHSSSGWRRDEPSGTIGFEFAFEDGRVVTKTDPRFAGQDLSLLMEDFWPWPEIFRTGKPSLIDDIRTVPPFALRDRLLPLGIVTVLLVPMSIAGRLEGAIGLRCGMRIFRSNRNDVDMETCRSRERFQIIRIRCQQEVAVRGKKDQSGVDDVRLAGTAEKDACAASQ